MNALRYRVVPRGCKVAAGSVRVAIPLDSRDHFGLIQTLPPRKRRRSKNGNPLALAVGKFNGMAPYG